MLKDLSNGYGSYISIIKGPDSWAAIIEFLESTEHSNTPKEYLYNLNVTLS